MKPHKTKIRRFRLDDRKHEQTHCHRGRSLIVERDHHKDEPTE